MQPGLVDSEARIESRKFDSRDESNNQRGIDGDILPFCGSSVTMPEFGLNTMHCVEVNQNSEA